MKWGPIAPTTSFVQVSYVGVTNYCEQKVSPVTCCICKFFLLCLVIIHYCNDPRNGLLIAEQ